MIRLEGLPIVTVVVLLVVPLLMLAAMLTLVRSFSARPLDDAEPAPAERPWWANPIVWIGAGAVFLLLGVFVLPHFFGGLVFFLPFVWVGGGRRRARR